MNFQLAQMAAVCSIDYLWLTLTIQFNTRLQLLLNTLWFSCRTIKSSGPFKSLVQHSDDDDDDQNDCDQI